MDNLKPAYIYALRDPYTYRVRYVGKSYDPVMRLNFHVRGAYKLTKTYKDRWLNTIIRKPILEILEYLNLNKENWQESEKWWISEMHRRGEPITNGTPGGEGGGVIHTEESRRKISESQIGKSRAKCIEGCICFKHSKETSEKISASLKGHVGWWKGKKRGTSPFKGGHFTEEAKRKSSESHMGLTPSPETRLKLSISQTNHHIRQGHKIKGQQ